MQHSGSLGSTIDVTSNGPFDFDPDRVAAGDMYIVSVTTQPSGESCAVTNGSGTAKSVCRINFNWVTTS